MCITDVGVSPRISILLITYDDTLPYISVLVSYALMLSCLGSPMVSCLWFWSGFVSLDDRCQHISRVWVGSSGISYYGGWFLIGSTWSIGFMPSSIGMSFIGCSCVVVDLLSLHLVDGYMIHMACIYIYNWEIHFMM